MKILLLVSILAFSESIFARYGGGMHGRGMHGRGMQGRDMQNRYQSGLEGRNGGPGKEIKEHTTRHGINSSDICYGYNNVLNKSKSVKEPQGKPFQDGDSMRKISIEEETLNERAYALVFSIMAPIRDALFFDIKNTSLNDWNKLTSVLTMNNIKLKSSLNNASKRNDTYSTTDIYNYVKNNGTQRGYHPSMRYVEEAELELKCMLFSETFNFVNPEGIDHCKKYNIRRKVSLKGLSESMVTGGCSSSQKSYNSFKKDFK